MNESLPQAVAGAIGAVPGAAPAEAAPGTLPVNLEEYEPLARAVLPPHVYDFVAGGAEDERTVARNRAAFARLLLRPRVLAGIRQPSLATTVLGQTVALPVLLAPTGEHCLVHPEGETATARAAGAAGTVLIVSTASSLPLEAVAAASALPGLWFQLYALEDRDATAALVRRAAAAGYRALVLTVDTPVLGRREREIRSGYAVRRALHRGNFPDGRVPPHATLTWEDLDWLRSLSPLPLVVKGVMRGDDAARAVAHGAAGVIVSNHGGRQLDGVPATLEVLEEVVQAVADRAEVYLDGGVRRGTDVLKALALGARAVCIGRPYLWGLAVAGQAGVERVLALLREELAVAMHLAGCADVQKVPRDLAAWDPIAGTPRPA